jgi:hypothetical protein
MAPKRPPIFSAIVFHNGEEDYDNTSMVTAPLLQHCDGEIHIGNNDEEEEEDEASSKRKLFHRLFCIGILIGFLIQAVSSLGAYAVILVYWGDKFVQKTEGDWFRYQHTIISILAHVDVYFYFLIWIAFGCAINRLGMPRMLRDQFQTPANVLYFLVGLIVTRYIYLGLSKWSECSVCVTMSPLLYGSLSRMRLTVLHDTYFNSRSLEVT